MDKKLRTLEKRIEFGDYSALVEYVRLYQRIFQEEPTELIKAIEKVMKSGDYSPLPYFVKIHTDLFKKAPDLKKGRGILDRICFRCATHGQTLYTFQYDPQMCPKETWDRYEKIYKKNSLECHIKAYLMSYNWYLNDAMNKNNLFALKKREFKDSTSSEELMNRFYELQKNDPGYIIFPGQIHHYFDVRLSKAVQIIAELNMISSDEIVSWEEFAEKVNLRTDLIEGRPALKDIFLKLNASYCVENHFPISLLYANILYKRHKGSGFSGSNMSLAVTTISDYEDQEIIIPKYSILG